MSRLFRTKVTNILQTRTGRLVLCLVIFMAFFQQLYIFVDHNINIKKKISTSSVLPDGQKIVHKDPSLDWYCQCKSLPNSVLPDGGLCGDYSSSRGQEQKVISFSYYGSNITTTIEDNSYFQGITLNLEAMKVYYPGYIMRVYHNVTHDNDPKCVEKLCEIFCDEDSLLDLCDVTHLGRYGDSSRFFGMLWRYATMADPLVSEVHFRDLDSTISGREVSAVSDWRDKSDAAFHIMRDHPEHETTILGGGFGVRKPLGEDNAKGPFALLLKDLYEKMMMASRAMWVAELDQILLETVVWPFAQKNMVAHDSYCCTEMDLVSDYNRAWPTQRINGANYSSVGEPNFFGSNGGEITLSEQGPCPLQCRPVDHQDWLLC